MDDNLNFDDFKEYLGKYNDFLKNMSNDEYNTSFLDLDEKPSEHQMVSLFIHDDDVRYSVDSSDYNINELGEPDNYRMVEGVVWSVVKNSWAVPEGNIVSFLLINTGLEVEDLTDIRRYDLGRDVDAVSESELTYNELLEISVTNEDYPEAARLRDWSLKFKDLIKELDPKLEEALKNNEYETYFKLIKKIQNFKKF